MYGTDPAGHVVKPGRPCTKCVRDELQASWLEYVAGVCWILSEGVLNELNLSGDPEAGRAVARWDGTVY